ncbi:MAG: YeeE/YedE family protein [Bdellovibrionales bacterium]|nr:YeeE/YedE family protein [Bdellovibrionales bacterium]
MHMNWPSLAGGLLVGFASALLLVGAGRVAGVSGIAAQALYHRKSGDILWRWLFLLGLVAGGFAGAQWLPQNFPLNNDPLLLLGAAGLLVGIGAKLANGCTSGHGICGLGRGSLRSLVAVLTFLAFGALTVYLRRS